MLVSNKRQNGWTDQAQILCGTSRDQRQGLWMIKLKKITSNKIRFLKILKIHVIFYIIRKILGLFLFYNVHKDNMFTIEIEDGREAP